MTKEEILGKWFGEEYSCAGEYTDEQIMDTKAPYHIMPNALLRLIKLAQAEQRKKDAEAARNTQLSGTHGTLREEIARNIEKGGV